MTKQTPSFSGGRSATPAPALKDQAGENIPLGLTLRSIPLGNIRLDARNPRTDGEGSVDELAASLRGAGLVQPPIVVAEEDGYRVLVGERRVRAARQAGLDELPCLVSDPLDPIAAHRARVVENLHRRELNPIDHAQALRVAWLLANAEALGLGGQAGGLMSAERPLSAILPDLEALLDEHGFRPTAPAVTWEQVLDELGIEMNPARRKKLLRVLSLPADVQEKLRQLPVTEAAVRALGTLDETALRQVADAIEENPDLARRARRIAHAVRGHGYSVEEALAEASGQVLEHEWAGGDGDKNPGTPIAQPVGTDAALALLDAANAFLAALEGVRQAGDLPDPWRGYVRNALESVRSEIETF